MHKLKVLIADDEEIIVAGLKGLYDWSGNGYELVGEAFDGATAVRIARDLSPDVILMDINMPYKNGLEAIREIAHHVPGAGFLVISGYSDFALVREALHLQVSDYLLKPVKIDDLADALSRLRINILERRNLRDVRDETRADHSKERAVRSGDHADRPCEGTDDANSRENREINREERLIDQMIDYIDDHLVEELSLKKMAGIFNMNAYYISSYFKKKSGLNFVDYLNSRRILKAKILLEKTDLSIGKIADAVGFSNYRYFSRTFQRYTGKLPSQYRTDASSRISEKKETM